MDNYDGAYAGENNNLLTILRDQYVIIVNKDDDARSWRRVAPYMKLLINPNLNDKNVYFNFTLGGLLSKILLCCRG